MSSDLNEQTITEAVQRTFDTSTDQRFREVFACLVQHLHDFAREVRLTGDEWFTAMDFLERVGKISSPTRQELVLLSDILGLSMLLDRINQHSGSSATDSALLGPFYVEGRPTANNGADISDGVTGTPMFVTGRVVDEHGKPDRRRPRGHLAQRRRGVLRRSADRKAARRVRHAGSADHRRGRPVLVPVHHAPLLPGAHRRAMRGNHARRKPIVMRPQHVHFWFHADGYQPLITQLFCRDDPYIGRDAVFADQSTRCRRITCGTSQAPPRTERRSTNRS